MLVTIRREIWRRSARHCCCCGAPDGSPTRPTSPRREHLAAALDVGHEMFTSMALTVRARCARCGPTARIRRQSRRRWNDRGHTVIGQPRQVVLEEGLDPGPLQSDGVQHSRGVSTMRGVGRPERGLSMMLLVTTHRSRSGRRTPPVPYPPPARPEAVNAGTCESTPPSVTRGSVIARLWRSRVSAGTVPTSDQRTRSPKKTGPSVRTDHAGHAVIADHRQHAGHTHADTAGHGLLDRALRHGPEFGADLRNGLQHSHRTAGIDRRMSAGQNPP